MKKGGLFFVGLIAAGLSSSVLAGEESFSGLGLGFTTGRSDGAHSLKLEVDQYTLPLAADGLRGGSAGVTVDYLFKLGQWRLGPQWVSEKTSFTAADLIGNKYVNLKTSLGLEEMHSLRLVLGRVTYSRYFPYVFVGVAAGLGTLSAELNVLEYSAGDTAHGWMAGPQLGLGIKYQMSSKLEIGLEYAETRFNRKFRRCPKELPICVALPVQIEPKTINLTLTKRF
jgi:opacity protein-like surface antigen